ncbi:hypothetical protein RJT34_11255 [Clitoria ternatea]|uniref:PGG domain-containing protein n=1 Tax=Clitoria ternatea TaxID=43366 RepID=A0AAN9PJD7_CLITE
MDPRVWHKVAAISGVAALGLGTYGAHAFKPQNPSYKDVWHTASLYHLVHTAALVAAPITKNPNVFGGLLTAGILAFSGTCYTVAYLEDRKYSTLAPFGGFAFIAAWGSFSAVWVRATFQYQPQLKMDVAKTEENNQGESSGQMKFEFPAAHGRTFVDKDAKMKIERGLKGVNVGRKIDVEPGYFLDNGRRESPELDYLADVYNRMVRGASTAITTMELREFKTPMGDTLMHAAARFGNDVVVDEILQHAPDLLLWHNSNRDTPLHTAARAGHILTLNKMLLFVLNTHGKDALSSFILKTNKQGNTMLHEAIVGGIATQIFQLVEEYDNQGDYSLSRFCYNTLALTVANNAYQSVLYLAVQAGHKETVMRILDKCHESALPMGYSPLVSAILNRDQDMLKLILERKADWVHVEDGHRRVALHYAALKGYHEGVVHLLGQCKSCTIRRDLYGCFPIHLASHGGHLEVFKMLLDYCLDPIEMRDNFGRNILHVAAERGKHKVVSYILQISSNTMPTGSSFECGKGRFILMLLNGEFLLRWFYGLPPPAQIQAHYRVSELSKMINQKDKDGNTPLHLATMGRHPKTVYTLTWDQRVDLTLLNQKGETALNIVIARSESNKGTFNLQERLIWTALKSAGTKPSSVKISQSNSEPNEEGQEKKASDDNERKVASSTEPFKDRVETLIVVSTLIITASVAACLSVPGEADGAANNLDLAMFKVFSFSITISLFTSVGTTIILIWTKLGSIELLAYALKLAMPLLGIALTSLCIAFLAGVYTVICNVRWLATTFVVMTVILIVIVVFLFTLLFLPSASTRKPLRYISYYPFLFLASLAEPSHENHI